MKNVNTSNTRKVRFSTSSFPTSVHIPARVTTLWQPSKKKTKLKRKPRK